MITTSGRARAAADPLLRLDGFTVGRFDRAVQHVPIDDVRAALRDVQRVEPDVLVAFGGGSPIGLAKAIALETSLPIAAVPTTYAGSEMTGIWGITDETGKRTGRDARVAPTLVVYDPALTLDLPPEASAASGMNAIAHAVEALYAPDANPVASVLSERAIARLSDALPRIVSTPRDRDARASALVGAHFAGAALGQVAMGLHHKLCHVLGGTFGLSHALTHAIVLPHVVRFNAEAALEPMRRVAEAMAVRDAAEGLLALNERLGLPRSLVAIGFDLTDVDRAADLATASAYANPRPVTRDDVKRVLLAASEPAHPPPT